MRQPIAVPNVWMKCRVLKVKGDTRVHKVMKMIIQLINEHVNYDMGNFDRSVFLIILNLTKKPYSSRLDTEGERALFIWNAPGKRKMSKSYEILKGIELHTRLTTNSRVSNITRPTWEHTSVLMYWIWMWLEWGWRKVAWRYQERYSCSYKSHEQRRTCLSHSSSWCTNNYSTPANY